MFSFNQTSSQSIFLLIKYIRISIPILLLLMAYFISFYCIQYRDLSKSISFKINNTYYFLIKLAMDFKIIYNR